MAASRRLRPASRRSASDSLLGSARASAFATSAAEVWAGVSSSVCAAGVVFAGTEVGAARFANSASLAFATNSSSGVTAPAGSPSMPMRGAPAVKSAEIAAAAGVGPERGPQVAPLDRAAERGQGVGVHADLERPRVLPAAAERLRETIA